MAENIKVNELEIGAQLQEDDRFLVLTDEVNNEVKTIPKPFIVSGLISKLENNLLTNNNGLFVDGNTFNELIEALKEIQERQADEIGRPIITLSNTLLDDEIWLEGATVSRTTYANLFDIYGTTYGAGDGSTTFKLPDFRNRVIWGASNFGYLNAAYPTVTVPNTNWGGSGSAHPNSTTQLGTLLTASARSEVAETLESVSYSTGSKTATVSGNLQPPAIKARIKTRFK